MAFKESSVNLIKFSSQPFSQSEQLHGMFVCAVTGHGKCFCNILQAFSSSSNSLPGAVATVQSNILGPLKVCDFSFTFLTHVFEFIKRSSFPFELKRCEVTSVFKANDQMTKGNYRPITLLSAISKVYERLMSEQIVVYSESFLFQNLCEFRERDSIAS